MMAQFVLGKGCTLQHNYLMIPWRCRLMLVVYLTNYLAIYLG